MARIRWIGPILVICVIGALLAACGNDDEKDTTSSATPTTAAAKAAGITVTMKDYSYQVGGKMTAGDSIDLKNDGNELHMMGVGKLKAGATVAQVKDALAKADPQAEGDPTGGLIEEEVGWPGAIVTPGHEVTLSAADLQPGTYALICFMPTEGTGEPHFTKGMLSELDVVAGSAAASKPDATYKVTAGQPMQGPSTLKAGTRTIEVTGDADISKQEPQLVKAESADQSPDAINDVLNKYFGELESGKAPQKGSGKAIAEYLPFAGFDFNATKSVTFTYDFEPGTYYLAAPDTDNQNGPSTVPKELIKITVT